MQKINKKRIKIGLIGCGAVSQILYKRSLIELKDQIELTGLVDTNKLNADKFSSDFPKAKYYRRIDDFLDSNLPDAVIIALPHFLHSSTVIACIKKGIHVLCEKPMATNIKDARAMIKAADKYGKILEIGYFRRYFRSTQKIKQIIDERLLGKVVRFDFIEGENYSWPAVSNSFFSYKSAGGGVLIDAGAHTTDLMLWWFGDYKSVDYYDDGALTGVESDVSANIVMDSGVKGRLRMSRTSPLANKYKIKFEKGWIVWNSDDVNHFEMGFENDQMPIDVNLLYNQMPTMTVLNGRPKSPPGFYDYFTEQLNHFLNCISGNEKPLIDGREGLKSLRFIEECYKNRKPIRNPWRDYKREKLYASVIGKTLKKQKIKNIAIVGASGFVGQRLVEYLSNLDANEFNILPMVHRLASAARLQSQGTRLVQVDVLDKKSVMDECKNVDVLFCTFVGGTDVIVGGMRNLLNTALKNGVKKVVYLSTQLVYGFDPSIDLIKESVPNPKRTNWYTYSSDKARVERIIETYRAKGLVITVLRPGIVYGPYGKDWTYNLIEKIIAGKMFLIDKGEGSCDTIFVDDLVEAMISSAADRRVKNANYNISDGRQTTWGKFIKTYCSYYKFPFEKILSISEVGKNTYLAGDSIGKLKKISDQIFKNRVAIGEIIMVLPFGNTLMEIAKKLMIRDNNVRTQNTKSPNENLDKELFYLQLGKSFLPSSKLNKHSGWKARHSLDKGVMKSIQWYKSLF